MGSSPSVSQVTFNPCLFLFYLTSATNGASHIYVNFSVNNSKFQFLCALKAAALKQQITKCQQQILSTEASLYIDSMTGR